MTTKEELCKRAKEYYWKNRDTILAKNKAKVVTNREFREARNALTKVWCDKEQLRNPITGTVRKNKKKCDRKGIPYTIDKDWANRKYTGFCDLTLLPFSHGKLSPFSASIDRIVPEKGYVEENCRIVLLGVNGLKHTGTDADMYKIAEALITNKPKDLS